VQCYIPNETLARLCRKRHDAQFKICAQALIWPRQC